MLTFRKNCTTETGRLFLSETHKTVAVGDKGESFGSHGLKMRSEKSNSHEHIPLCTVYSVL